MNTLPSDDERQLESAFADAVKAFPPPAGLKEALRERVFSRQATAAASPSPRRTAWRRLRRLVPGAIVASLVFAALVWIVWPETELVSVAYAELAEVLENTDQAEWVHYFEKDGREIWMSFRPFRCYSKSPGGVFAMDRSKNRKYRYDAAKGTLTVSFMGAPGDAESHPNVSEFMRRFVRRKVDHWERTGSEVGKGTETLDGKTMTVYVVTVNRDGKKEGTLKYYVDPQTDRVVAIQGAGAGALSWYKPRVEFDYPDEGPQSVYDVGVPRDAKIIDETPPSEVLDLVRKVDEADEARPKEYYRVSIMVYERFSAEYPPWSGATVEVSYHKDGQLREDRYRVRCPRPMSESEAVEYLEKLDKEIPVDRLEDVERWLADRKPYRIILSDAELATVYELSEEGELALHRFSSGVVALGLHAYLDGKPVLIEDQGPWGKLVGIENHDTALKLHRFYYNPNRDYLCEKIERQVEGVVSERTEVVEYGKTPAGRWFAKRQRKTEYRGRDTILFTNFRDDLRTIDPAVFDASRITPDVLSRP